MAPPAPAPGRPATGVGHYLRDLVYGALDGVVTTLVIVAAASGAQLGAGVALVLGLANVVADGISMGAANYLALRSELEQAGRSVAAERPVRHGAATMAAFALAGAVPLLAFLNPAPQRVPTVALALALGAATLAVAGGARAPFVAKPAWRAGLEMLAVGAVATAAAFAVGAAARGLAA